MHNKNHSAYYCLTNGGRNKIIPRCIRRLLWCLSQCLILSMEKEMKKKKENPRCIQSVPRGRKLAAPSPSLLTKECRSPLVWSSTPAARCPYLLLVAGGSGASELTAAGSGGAASCSRGRKRGNHSSPLVFLLPCCLLHLMAAMQMQFVGVEDARKMAAAAQARAEPHQTLVFAGTLLARPSCEARFERFCSAWLRSSFCMGRPSRQPKIASTDTGQASCRCRQPNTPIFHGVHTPGVRRNPCDAPQLTGPPKNWSMDRER